MKGGALVDEARRLSVEERLQLVEAIWNTVASDADAVPVPPEHQEELERRLADIVANPEAGSPWEVVRSRLERRDR